MNKKILEARSSSCGIRNIDNEQSKSDKLLVSLTTRVYFWETRGEMMFNPELYFYYILLLTLLVFTHLFHKRTKDLSKTLFITITALFFVSVVCSISLALNYYQSLKPNTEGIGISNVVAYWLLGEDAWAPAWTIQLFKKAYSISLWITLILLGFLIILLFMKRKQNKTKDTN